MSQFVFANRRVVLCSKLNGKIISRPSEGNDACLARPDKLTRAVWIPRCYITQNNCVVVCLESDENRGRFLTATTESITPKYKKVIQRETVTMNAAIQWVALPQPDNSSLRLSSMLPGVGFLRASDGGFWNKQVITAPWPNHPSDQFYWRIQTIEGPVNYRGGDWCNIYCAICDHDEIFDHMQWTLKQVQQNELDEIFVKMEKSGYQVCTRDPVAGRYIRLRRLPKEGAVYEIILVKSPNREIPYHSNRN